MERDQPIGATRQRADETTSQRSHSRIPVIGQAKLVVGGAGDAEEVEADRIADQLVRSLRSGGGGGLAVADSRIRRSDAVGRDDTRLVAQRLVAGSRIRRRSIGPEGGALDDDTERSLQRARSGGQPLDPGLQRSMGDAMGADLSGVQVHTGSESDSLNERMGAKAFTVGNDVFFSGGMPSTSSAAGLHLVAHEVAHTVQQGASPVRRAPDPEAPAAEPEASTSTTEHGTLKGKISSLEMEPDPTLMSGRLPLQEDTRRSNGAGGKAVRRAGAASTSNLVTIDGHFSSRSQVRRVDRMPADGVRDDAVGRAITYGSAISGTYNATAFGAMQPAARYENVAWELADGKLQVDAQIYGTFDYGVNSGGNVDVASATAPLVTHKNYAEIAADLKPKLEGGSWRAPRSKYWSSALTERHERFHADDSDGWFRAEGAGIVRAYLARNPIVLSDDERTDAGVVQGKVIKALSAARGEMYKQYTTAMTGDLGPSGYLNFPTEIRAFGDGKVPYEQLSAGVKAQGEKLAAARGIGDKIKDWFSSWGK